MRSRIALIIIFLLVAMPAWAATYYAAPKGSAGADNTASGSGTIGDPWSVVRAMSSAIAGDVVNFRGGTYYAGQSNNTANLGFWNPSNSGTSGSPITFQAYPGETPVMDAATSGGNLVSRALGNGHQNYITFDGFWLRGDGGSSFGSMAMCGSDMDNHATGGEVKNCIFQGSNSRITSTDNNTGLFIQDQDYVDVYNCTFYRYWESTDYHNTSALKFYHTRYIKIYNCHIYDCTTGIYNKSGNPSGANNHEYYNNYIHDCAGGIYYDANYQFPDNKIYNNVIWGCTAYPIHLDHGGTSSYTNDIQIYNNTLYQSSNPSSVVLSIGNGLRCIVYNNILIGNGSDFGTFRIGSGTTLTTCDYNEFGSSFRLLRYWTAYTSISTWSAAITLTGGGHPDTHSLSTTVANIKFVNSSGNMNTLADFALQGDSPCVGTGSGGTDMGADISLVGVDAGEEDPPSTPSIRNGGFRSGGIR